MTETGQRRAVAIGGGTGLPRVLTALLRQGWDTTAIVTMADDGGSSGALRRDIGMPPPGDVRNCLVALSEPDALRTRLFQYRFEQGEGLVGHSLGNLVIAALTELTGSFVEAVRVGSEFLGAKGSVVPSTLEDVSLIGVDREGNAITGQAVLARSAVPIAEVKLEPPDPGACPEAVAALREADLVLVGPGSLFTSIIPNFLVEEIADALRASRARRVYICNVANQRGETAGLDAADHVRALLAHGLDDALDSVVVHDTHAYPSDPASGAAVEAGPEVLEEIRELGLSVVAADVADPEDPAHHDPDRLAPVIGAVA